MRTVKRGHWEPDFDGRVLRQPHQSAEDEFFEEPELDPVCTHDVLYQAMNQLTTRQAWVVRLHYGLDESEQLTQQEIADIAGWHLSTVQEHLFRAEQKLHKVLTGEVRRNTP